MKYAKLINGVLIFAPKNKGSIINYNLNIEEMTKDGYKPLIEAGKEDGKAYEYFYKDTKNSIKEVVKEIIPEPVDEEAQRREYLDGLVISSCDVEHALYHSIGMTFDDLKKKIQNEYPEIDIKDLGIELRRGTFKRDNAYVNQIGALLGYTTEDLDYLFKNKDLPPQKEEKESEERNEI